MANARWTSRQIVLGLVALVAIEGTMIYFALVQPDPNRKASCPTVNWGTYLCEKP